MKLEGITHDVGCDQAWPFGKEFITLLRHYQLPQMHGRDGALFGIYWGEVSEDSDGLLESCRPVPADEAQALSARCPELTLRTQPAHQDALVKPGANGQIGATEWQLVAQSLHASSEQQQDLTDLGSRITYLANEPAQETHSDCAVPFNGRSRR